MQTGSSEYVISSLNWEVDEEVVVAIDIEQKKNWSSKVQGSMFMWRRQEPWIQVGEKIIRKRYNSLQIVESDKRAREVQIAEVQMMKV